MQTARCGRPSGEHFDTHRHSESLGAGTLAFAAPGPLESATLNVMSADLAAEIKAAGGLAKDGLLSGSAQAKLLIDHAQVLAVRRLRSPKFAGKVAAPNTAVRRVGGDDLQARLMHVAERIALSAAHREKCQLCVRIRVLRQSEHICEHRALLGPAVEVQAFVE